MPLPGAIVPTTYTNELLEAILAALSGGVPAGSSYNNKSILELKDAGTGVTYSQAFAGNSLHILDISVIEGGGFLTIGTDPAINMPAGFSIRLDATNKIVESIQVDTDPLYPVHIIITTTK
jgi:hypothetical protein